ncbi:glycoside hydrolase family 2 TIM barrel-domain containing protein [Flavihumibacter fluvii]|uniref:glycoside hydrolase family 2 TIM barrel-domain containing protein n=1 Tax=Flavihumibacter fluvii TaxID=2838157 RepID=UPI001BDF3C88|nr:glycoside hydrolase family 2 TIM barrel-domain containing protein [Flavihumibacter fluvii]ULQ50852.1 DUF4981 domain-containing protein [Flavihumibacter fluvii]
MGNSNNRRWIFIFFTGLFWCTCLSAQNNNDWENPQAVSLNTEPPHAHMIPYASELAAKEAAQSDRIFSLNGLWLFKWVDKVSDRPLDFFTPGFNATGWASIKVPAHWQTEGFDRFIFTDVEYPIKVDPPFVPKEFNPVGSYLREFNLPASFLGSPVYLHFGAVNSFFYCWINGQFLGFSKDSKTPAEFEVGKYLKKGKNSIAVQVFRFSDGTYLEGQDMWKLSGIERSVYLVKRPVKHIADYFVQASLDDHYRNGLFSLDILLKGNMVPDGSVEIKILHPDSIGKIVFQSQQPLLTDSLHFSAKIDDVLSWNAERPNLYGLYLVHRNKKGDIIEVIRQSIGFRRVEIRHGLFLVNGVAVKLRGVNRHEHDMVTGKVITRESMLQDIRLMKANNINAVRNSHYPNDEYWYRLCDKYGIYVVDEANIECDGMAFHPLETLSDHSAWTAAYLDRTKRMVERDKNFTCIVTWSLGNESRFGKNFVATYEWIKGRDQSRPVQYEEARDNPYTDIFCPMYKATNVLLEYVKEWRARPLILSEYAHMMGNSGGVLKDDWDLINKYPQLQGGFIWDFSDQTFLKKDKNGRDIWAYGSDMGSVGATSDTSFCADGLFQADRQPHPQAFEMKQVYAPVAFEAAGLSADQVRIFNRYDFTNLDQLNFTWRLRSDGKDLALETLPIISLAPHESIVVSLGIPSFPQEPGKKYFLYLEARTRFESPLLPANSQVAIEQLALPGYPAIHNITMHSGPALAIEQQEKSVRIVNSTTSIAFNKQTGWLSSWVVSGKEILAGPLIPDFWRPVTDNDIGNGLQVRCAVWKDPAGTAELDSLRVSEAAGHAIVVVTEHRLPKVAAVYRAEYTIWPDGVIAVRVNFLAGKVNQPELPRFGMKVLVKPEYDQVTWLGRGPFDNYADRKAASFIDIYSLNAADFFHPYPRAQESGYRTDLSWARLQDSTGKGFALKGDQEFCIGVLHFDRNKLEFDRTRNIHGGSIEPDDFIWLNIDLSQMGLGGDNSWGTRTHSEYTLPYQDYQYGFTLEPYK